MTLTRDTMGLLFSHFSRPQTHKLELAGEKDKFKMEGQELKLSCLSALLRSKLLILTPCLIVEMVTDLIGTTKANEAFCDENKLQYDKNLLDLKKPDSGIYPVGLKAYFDCAFGYVMNRTFDKTKLGIGVSNDYPSHFKCLKSLS